MRTLTVLLTFLVLTPINAMASSWSCSMGRDVREVQIERPADAYVPCQVVYRKLTEGVEDQVLWNAQNDDSFCEEKAEGFIARLEEWGWVCRETVSENIVTETTEPEMHEEAVEVMEADEDMSDY